VLAAATTPSTDGLDDLPAILLIALGVVIALVWPVLYNAVRKVFPKTAAGGLSQPLKDALVKTGIVSAFALVTAIAIYAVAKSADDDLALQWFQALVAGFAWEATLEKTFLSPARQPSAG
jgi:hypothetical protein